MHFGLSNCHEMVQIKTKSCGNGIVLYKVDDLTACYLNHCSQIASYGKLLYLHEYNMIVLPYQKDIRSIFNVRNID